MVHNQLPSNEHPSDLRLPRNYGQRIGRIEYDKVHERIICVKSRRKFDETFKRRPLRIGSTAASLLRWSQRSWASLPTSCTPGESWLAPALGGVRRRLSRARSPISKASWRPPSA